MTGKGNILQDLPDAAAAEVFQTLQDSGQVLIERIVSRGQVSPPGFWHEQARAEWVMLVQGAARVEWESGECVALETGDYVAIPAGQRHRVAWTDPSRKTVWLAVHYPVA